MSEASAETTAPDVRIYLGCPPRRPHPIFDELVQKFGLPVEKHSHPGTQCKHAAGSEGSEEDEAV